MHVDYTSYLLNYECDLLLKFRKQCFIKITEQVKLEQHARYNSWRRN